MRTVGKTRNRSGLRAPVLGLTAVMLLVGACSSGGSGATDTGVSRQPGDCAWPTRADTATLNVAYPDTGATYWGTRYHLARGERLEISGAFPHARYFSFITYKSEGGVRDVLTDRDVTATSGTNPFAGDTGGSATDGRYTVTVVPGDASAPDTLHGGTNGSVVYRVYLPAGRSGPKGGVALPGLRVVGPHGAHRDLPPCARPGASPRTVRIVNERGPATDTAAPATPTFVRPKNAANLFPNPDNVYIATLADYVPGRLLIVRGRAPTFPDTRNGQPVTTGDQVRYWSVCTNQYRKPYPVTACVADQDVPLGTDRAFTVVISTRAERPANATAAHGIAWLDWGNTRVTLLVLVRHMLASPDFPQSAINVPLGALASSSMGDYAPRGVSCSVADFARLGPAACPG
ncbi:MAG: hypothetical protein ACXV8T_02085 [Acidimicrobiia bacterium]